MHTDQTLVEACLRGDGKAFARLVDRYRYPVFGICLGYTGDFDAAEDAAQEAFIAAFMKLGDLRNHEVFGPWLKQMAANAGRTWRRRQQRLTPLDTLNDAALVSSVPSPEAQMAQSDARREVLAAIGRLTEAQRQVVTLFYLEEMSLKDIGDFLGVSVQAVNQRLYRARLYLKKEMLEMVRETLGDHQLPPDFTEQVIQEILDRGEQRLKDRAWTSAQQAFRKVTEALPEHVGANRGLALALEGELKGRIRQGSMSDEGLVQETFEALERACDLGATDEILVRRLASLLSSFGRNREGGQFLERVAASREDWREQIRFLGSAIAVYYHSHYRNGEDNKAACVRCHRRMRELVPADLEPRLKMHVWTPSGMALAYPHEGLADEVLSEMDALESAIGDAGGIWEYFQMALIRSNTFRELKQHDRMAAAARTFVDWVAALPEDDPRLHRPSLSLREGGAERGKIGPSARFHTWGFMLGTLAQAEYRASRDVTGIFEELDRVLERNEAYVRDVQEEEADASSDDGETKELARRYARAGEAAAITPYIYIRGTPITPHGRKLFLDVP